MSLQQITFELYVSFLLLRDGHQTMNLSTIGFKSLPLRDSDLTLQKLSMYICLANGLRRRILLIEKPAQHSGTAVPGPLVISMSGLAHAIMQHACTSPSSVVTTEVRQDYLTSLALYILQIMILLISMFLLLQKSQIFVKDHLSECPSTNSTRLYLSDFIFSSISNISVV